MYTQYGINCFRSEIVCLCGQLKKKPEDFKVNEIGLDGKVAGKEDIIKEISSLAPKKRKTNAAEIVTTTINVAKVKETESTIPWKEIQVDPEKQMKFLIGEVKFKELAELVSSMSPESKIDLGCFNEKNDRSVLHQCIRYIFPSVKSSPVKNEENTSVACIIDPSFLELRDIGVGKETVEKLLVYINCRLLKNTLNCAEPLVFDVSKLEKKSRERLHHLLQDKYGKFLESKTFFKGTHSISVRFKERKEVVKRNKRKFQEVFCVVLLKENLELLNALHSMARELKVEMCRIKFAGLKDKRAVTHQFVSVSNVKLSDIKEVSESVHTGWKILFPPQTVVQDLQLGDLSGNQFEIIVRNVNQSAGALDMPGDEKNLQEIMKSSVECMQTHGFLNYFGEQRFGLDLTTAMVGKQLLLGNFSEAVQLVFTPIESSEPSVDPAEHAKTIFLETQDVKKTIGLMPQYKVRECLILKALNRYSLSEDGCIKGFLSLPHSSRLFYIHSYCSYVWNLVLTRRIEKHSFNVLPGDLVWEEGDSAQPKHLSEEEVASGLYSFKDVLLPLPGTTVKFPENSTKEMFEAILKEDNIELTDLKVRKLNINNIPGAYRNAVSFASDLSWELKNDDGVNTNDLYLNFCLPSSTYATMFLRELFHSKSVLSL